MLLLLETVPLDYLVHYLPGAPPERAAPPLCRGGPVRGPGEALGGRGLWIGNTYLDDSGRDSPASLNSTGDM